MLAVAGNLQLQMGGPMFSAELKADYGFHSDPGRRSVYLPVFRNTLPEIFEVFDFADPSMVTGRRNVSTVRPGSVLDESSVCHRAISRDSTTPAGRTERDRSGPPDETLSPDARAFAHRWRAHIGLAFVSAGMRRSVQSEETWALLAQALFGSLDFRYR